MSANYYGSFGEQNNYIKLKMSTSDNEIPNDVTPSETSSMDSTNDSPDHVLNKFSPSNPYILGVFISSSTVWLFSGLTMMFSAFSVSEVCPKGQNCTINPNTINADFGLVGDRAYLADWATSVYLLGNMIGASTISNICDRQGRRLPMAFSLFLLGATGCVAALVHNIYLFMALRFIQGIFFPGCGIAGWNIAYESSPKRLRIYTTFVFGTMWVTGYCLVAPIAYFLPYWRSLLVACSFPASIFGVVYFFTMPESFHFMINQGDEKGLNAWLKRANQFGAKVDVNIKALVAAHVRKVKMDESLNQNIIIQMFRHKRLLAYMGIMAFLWISDTIIYYGLSLFSTQLSGNKFVNYVLSGLIEAPSNFASPWLLNKLGRRVFISGTHILAAVAFLLSIFITNPTAGLILWLVGKFGIICSFNCLYVYSSELFPTNVRSGCTGACEAVGRLAGTFAPALHSLSALYTKLPQIFFTVFAAVCGGVTLILPETSNLDLPSTAADL